MRSALFPGIILVCNVVLLSQFAYAETAGGTSESQVTNDAKDLIRVDEYTLKSPVHLVDGIAPVARENIVRVVVEIPTGSVQKWEVDKSSGDLRWEFKKDKPRVVKYLGYPGNYGMVPMTLLSKEHGGDGDPLDVLILSPAVPRGSVVEVSIIGVLELLDKGEHDDKLIAVMADGVFAKVDSIEELDRKFPGVTTIVETWFASYKGREKIEIRGYAGPEKANEVLAQALYDYIERSK